MYQSHFPRCQGETDSISLRLVECWIEEFDFVLMV